MKEGKENKSSFDRMTGLTGLNSRAEVVCIPTEDRGNEGYGWALAVEEIASQARNDASG